jgi:aldehyde:ferredoxin oxidoreductase
VTLMDLLGRLLEIDLDTGACRAREFPPGAARQWLGGRAFNVAYLYRHLAPEAAPLSPENILIFSCGLLTGTPVPTSSRLHLNALSPLTGLLGSSNVGGHFGAWLRSCGWQAVVLRGGAPAPVCLEIDVDGATLRDARDLWGLDTYATQERLEAQAGERPVKSLVIGPAGEARVPTACIVADRDHAAGRTGLGAVMGTKRLKAIVVHKGDRIPEPADPRGLREAAARFLDLVTASPDFRTFAEFGGAGYVQWADEKGFMAARHFQETHFAASAAIDGRRLRDKVVRTRGCPRCPVRCKAALEMEPGGDPAFRPEFEPMINLGAKCGLADLETLVRLDNLCTRLGIDSTSAGNAIALAMELHARGILSADETGGLDLAWGHGPAMETLIRDMAARRGLGGLLGLGEREAARRIGRGAEEFAVHVKGLELTAYHPAAILGTALGYAISSRGGDYNNVYASLEQRWTPERARQAFGTELAVDPEAAEGKGPLVALAVRVNTVLDSLGLCKVPTLSLVGTFDLVHEAALTAAVTGWGLAAADLMAIGQQAAALERLFNLRHGLDPADDRLPERFFQPPPARLTTEKFRRMLQEFYAAMGWNPEGTIPEALRAAVERALPGG